MSTIATASERFSTVELKLTSSASTDGRPEPSTRTKTAGITIAAAARKSIEDWTPAAVRSKTCLRLPMPPTSIAAPSTSSTLPMIEPMIVAFTSSCRPALRANRAMISSGALPKVTFSKPPIPGPERAANSSVARPMSAAVGMIPSAAAKKITVAEACASSSAIAAAINGTSR